MVSVALTAAPQLSAHTEEQDVYVSQCLQPVLRPAVLRHVGGF